MVFFYFFVAWKITFTPPDAWILWREKFTPPWYTKSCSQVHCSHFQYYTFITTIELKEKEKKKRTLSNKASTITHPATSSSPFLLYCHTLCQLHHYRRNVTVTDSGEEIRWVECIMECSHAQLWYSVVSSGLSDAMWCECSIWCLPWTMHILSILQSSTICGGGGEYPFQHTVVVVPVRCFFLCLPLLLTSSFHHPFIVTNSYIYILSDLPWTDMMQLSSPPPHSSPSNTLLTCNASVCDEKNELMSASKEMN